MRKPCSNLKKKCQQGAWGHRRHAWEAGSLHPPTHPSPRKTDFPCRVLLLASLANSPSQVPYRSSMYPVTFPGTFIWSFPRNTASILRGPKVMGPAQVQAEYFQSFRQVFLHERWSSKSEGDIQLSPQAFPLATLYAEEKQTLEPFSLVVFCFLL